MVDSLTPLHIWAENVGLSYQQAYRLVRKSAVQAVQPTGKGGRWYVVDGGIPEEDVDQRIEPDLREIDARMDR
jgi:hypothetical protein